MGAGRAGGARRNRDVPVVHAEQLDEISALDHGGPALARLLIRKTGVGQRRQVAARRRAVFARDVRAARQRPLEIVLDLAHVARPGVADQVSDEIRRQQLGRPRTAAVRGGQDPLGSARTP